MASALTSSSVWRHRAFCVSRQHRRVSTLWSYCYGFRFFAVVLGVGIKCFLQWISSAKVLLRANGAIFDNTPLAVRNIPKFKDRTNWSRDTFQPMRRRACVYQQTNQNIAPVIKIFQNNGRSRTESDIVSRLSGVFLRLFMRHTQFF